MQCEVCGSTSIKKVNDSIFECQSCGVQYDQAEVQKLLVELTGEVKIDHTKEIENALKRSEQFLQSAPFRAFRYHQVFREKDLHTLHLRERQEAPVPR